MAHTADNLDYTESTKRVESLLDQLKDNPRFESEVTDLELDGINVVSGAQLVQDFKDHIEVGGAQPDESVDEFKDRMDYKPHNIYIWSESVEDAINLTTLTSETVDHAGISEAFYYELKSIQTLTM